MTLKRAVQKINSFVMSLLLLIFGISSHAETIHIPASFATIQAGLNAAGEGDTVLVAPGTYTESLIWPTIHDIKLLSSGDPSNTEIIAETNTRNLLFPSGTDYTSATKIAGFKFSGTITEPIGMAGWGVFMSMNASPTIEDIVFEGYDFIITDDPNGEIAGLIFMSDNCSPIIQNCTFTDITGIDLEKVSGLALHIENNCHPIISDIVVNNCEVRVESRLYGGVIFIEEACNPKMNNISIYDMDFTSHNWNFGTGIYISDNCNPTFEHTKIHDMKMDSSGSNYGGAIYINEESNPVFNDLEISEIDMRVSGRVYGGAIHIKDYCNPIFTDIRIHDLYLSSENSFQGGAIHIADSCNAVLFESLVIENVVGYCEDDIVGLNMYISKSNPSFNEMVIKGGTGFAERYIQGGGVYVVSVDTVVFENFIICDNSIESPIGGSLTRVAGAGVRVAQDSYVAFTNGRITGNSLIGGPFNTFGAAMYVSTASKPNFINCTIVDNDSNHETTGSGIYGDFEPSPNFLNCIIRNPNAGDEIAFDGLAELTITASNVRGGYVGSGNIDMPEDFIGGCYYLGESSPSLGAGRVDIGVPADDLDGNERMSTGLGNPSMGAYENILPNLFIKDTIFVCGADTYFLEPDFKGCDYSWSTGEETSSILIAEDGNYYLSLSKGCCDYNDSVYVKLALEATEIDLGMDVSLCDGPALLDAGIGHQSYLWSDGSTNQLLDVTVGGEYSVIITAENGCTATDTIIVIDCDDPPNTNCDLLVFPNPALDAFTVSICPTMKIKTLQVFTIAGAYLGSEIVMSDKYQYLINASGFASGVYVVRVVEKSGNVLHERVVIGS